MTFYDEEEMEEIRAAFERLVLIWPRVSTRTMFGVPAYLADGKMFALLVTGGIVLTRLDETEREEIRQIFETVPFIGHGRVITKWVQVVVSPPFPEGIIPWVQTSYNAARKHV